MGEAESLTSLLGEDMSGLARVLSSENKRVFFKPRSNSNEPEYIMAYRRPNGNVIIAFL